jgi:hypothetical protein
MKQIEHDSQFTYNELQIFRETVARKYVRELENERPFAPEDTIDVFELVSPDSEPARSSSMTSGISSEASTEPKEQGGGMYSWIASWFGGGQSGSEQTNADEINKAEFLDMWPRIDEHRLPSNLRNVERRIEAEILDVLTESYDDSTILRRDTLLAELVLQLERMIIRFVDDEEVGLIKI